jgi:hypothetical protein
MRSIKTEGDCGGRVETALPGGPLTWLCRELPQRGSIWLAARTRL